MTFRSICIAVYVFFYLIFTTPMRARLKKLEKTDPQEASRIAQEQVQKVFKHLLKISGVTTEVTPPKEPGTAIRPMPNCKSGIWEKATRVLPPDTPVCTR